MEQQMNAPNPISNAIVQEDEENAQINEQVQPQEEITLRRSTKREKTSYFK